jgi:hypothetical protein
MRAVVVRAARSSRVRRLDQLEPDRTGPDRTWSARLLRLLDQGSGESSVGAPGRPFVGRGGQRTKKPRTCSRARRGVHRIGVDRPSRAVHTLIIKRSYRRKSRTVDRDLRMGASIPRWLRGFGAGGELGDGELRVREQKRLVETGRWAWAAAPTCEVMDVDCPTEPGGQATRSCVPASGAGGHRALLLLVRTTGLAGSGTFFEDRDRGSCRKPARGRYDRAERPGGGLGEYAGFWTSRCWGKLWD